MPASILPQVVKEFHQKTKPLSLSDPEVRALLAGATQIRIPLKQQPKFQQDELGGVWVWNPNDGKGRGGVVTWSQGGIDRRMDLIITFSPFAPGDVIAVREAWQKHENQTSFDQVESWICYRADGIPALDNGTVKPWRSAQHMPISMARIQRTVVAVRCERLWCMEKSDALACGVQVLPLQSAYDPSAWYQSEPGVNQERSASGSFRSVWDARYGKRYPWESSWCWVIDLKEESKR